MNNPTKVLLAVLLGCLLVTGAALAASMGPSCQYCGMSIEKYGYSKMKFTYKNKTEIETCSIRCGALEYSTRIDRHIKKIEVADFDTREYINAKKAHWILGGQKTPVMSKRAKWAFKDKKRADLFKRQFGGASVSFETAMQAAFADLYEDTQMIRMKRQKMKKSKMGH